MRQKRLEKRRNAKARSRRKKDTSYRDEARRIQRVQREGTDGYFSYLADEDGPEDFPLGECSG